MHSHDLGKSYADLMDQKGWHADIPPNATDLPPDDSATPPPVERIVEALLFVGGTPLSSQKACEIVRGLEEQTFLRAVEDLNQTYRRQGRPYSIVPRDGGHVLALKPRFQAVTDKLHGAAREARLSTAAVDVLALVAYRQPTTKAEIDSLRGAESGPLLRQLVRRGLIQVAFRADSSLPEASYATTQRFLELFGLESLDDLPRTQDLQQM